MGQYIITYSVIDGTTRQQKCNAGTFRQAYYFADKQAKAAQGNWVIVSIVYMGQK